MLPPQRRPSGSIGIASNNMARPKGSGGNKRTDAATRHGNGRGWGGPAKGASDKPAAPFEPGNQAAVGHGAWDWQAITDRRQQAELVKDQLYSLTFTGETGQVRVAAADKFLSRIEGAPVSRNVNFNADDISALDDDALAARREALERVLGSGDGGAASADIAPGSDEIRH